MSKRKQARREDSTGAPHYTIQIKWSDEDNCYVVLAPEWDERYKMPIASGKTYKEAARRGQNALENMIEFAKERGEPLPEPRTFAPAKV
jgi:predicted RNase H-like HicB family nuclease